MGTSAGIAPSLLDRTSDPALAQPIPRRVRIDVSGWTSLVGGWPELCVCMVAAPMVAVVAYGVLAPVLGVGGAALATTGLALFLLLALLAGAGDTSRALRAYRLARRGWAAGGELTRKVTMKRSLGVEYFIEYSFVDARGVHRRGKQEIGQDQWQAVSVHEPVTVLYDPQKPEQSLIYGLLGVMAIQPAGMRGALKSAENANSPSEPSADEPAPAEPAPAEPSPSEHPPSEPSADEPSPSEPLTDEPHSVGVEAKTEDALRRNSADR